MSGRGPSILGVLGREAALALLFLALAVYATRPLAADLVGQTLFGVDPPLYVWLVDWLARHLAKPAELFEGNIYYPAPHAALYADLALGSALLVAPLSPLVRDPVPLYNLSVILTLAFGGWAFCLLARRLSGSTAAGLLTGTLAAFGSHQLHHVYQLGLINIGWLALFLLGLFRIAGTPDVWGAVLTGVSFALNALSSAYYAVAAVVLALAFVAVHQRAFRSRKPWLAAAAALLLAFVLLLPYLRAFLLMHSTEGLDRPLVASQDMAFKPARDITSASYAYSFLLGHGGERLFPGVSVLGLAGLAIARRCRGAGFLCAGSLALLLLSLGPNARVLGADLGAAYRAVYAIPPLDVMMHPYTFAGAARLLLSVLAGLGFAGAHRLCEGRLGVVLAVGLGFVEIAGPGPGLRPLPRGIPPVYELLARHPQGAVLEVPLEARETMIWAARHRRPIVNGAGGVCPKVHCILERAIQRHWIRAAREAPEFLDIDSSRPTAILQEFPVRYLIVPSGRMPELLPLRRAFERSQLFAPLGVASDGDVLYQVIRPPFRPASPAGR
jgi:hypothetical protein